MEQSRKLFLARAYWQEWAEDVPDGWELVHWPSQILGRLVLAPGVSHISLCADMGPSRLWYNGHDAVPEIVEWYANSPQELPEIILRPESFADVCEAYKGSHSPLQWPKHWPKEN